MSVHAEFFARRARWIENSLQGAIIVEEGKVFDLTSLCFQQEMSGEAPSLITVATDINDRGEVIAQMVDASGMKCVVVLVPTWEIE